MWCGSMPIGPGRTVACPNFLARIGSRRRSSTWVRAAFVGTTSSVYVWTPELRAAVDMALEARPVDIAPWLFCTREGRPLIDENNVTNRFDSVWGRFMNRCLKETKLETRFAERNL